MNIIVSGDEVKVVTTVISVLISCENLLNEAPSCVSNVGKQVTKLDIILIYVSWVRNNDI